MTPSGASGSGMAPGPIAAAGPPQAPGQELEAGETAEATPRQGPGSCRDGGCRDGPAAPNRLVPPAAWTPGRQRSGAQGGLQDAAGRSPPAAEARGGAPVFRAPLWRLPGARPVRERPVRERPVRGWPGRGPPMGEGVTARGTASPGNPWIRWTVRARPVAQPGPAAALSPWIRRDRAAPDRPVRRRGRGARGSDSHLPG